MAVIEFLRLATAAEESPWTDKHLYRVLTSDAYSHLDPRPKIRRLAALDSLQYDRERKKAAEKLGVREQTLDRKVKEARTGSGAKQGREMILPEPDPWDEQVDGDALLDDLRAGLCRAIPAVNYIKSGFRL